MRALLHGGEVLTHPFVVGELACGDVPNRTGMLQDVRALPEATVAEHEEVLHLVESAKLYRRGIGWVDAHLLASALISRCGLWTLDRRLLAAAKSLGVAL